MFLFFFFKQKTAYEMRISDWSSDVCSSDLKLRRLEEGGGPVGALDQRLDLARQHGRQPEPKLDRTLQPILERLVVDPDGRLEGRDQVADHVFRGIVQQCCEPPARIDPRVQPLGTQIGRASGRERVWQYV